MQDCLARRKSGEAPGDEGENSESDEKPKENEETKEDEEKEEEKKETGNKFVNSRCYIWLYQLILVNSKTRHPDYDRTCTINSDNICNYVHYNGVRSKDSCKFKENSTP